MPGSLRCPDYLRAGVALALGTDSMASNNSADLFEEIKTAALLPRGVHHDPALVSGVDTLTMATSGGARALGGGLSGRLAAGEAADLILVDTGGPTGIPMTNPVAFLSYAARGGDVTDVFVAGRRLLADRVLTTLDEAAIRADADGAGGQDPRRTGVRTCRLSVIRPLNRARPRRPRRAPVVHRSGPPTRALQGQGFDFTNDAAWSGTYLNSSRGGRM